MTRSPRTLQRRSLLLDTNRHSRWRQPQDRKSIRTDSGEIPTPSLLKETSTKDFIISVREERLRQKAILPCPSSSLFSWSKSIHPIWASRVSELQHSTWETEDFTANLNYGRIGNLMMFISHLSCIFYTGKRGRGWLHEGAGDLEDERPGFVVKWNRTTVIVSYFVIMRPWNVEPCISFSLSTALCIHLC